MNLIVMIDELLRDRSALYRTAREGQNLRPLCLRLLAIFLISTAIYGGVMGAFRSIHPNYFFSDFELSTASGTTIKGDVAATTAELKTVYTHAKIPDGTTGATIRFNITNPSDRYQVVEIGQAKDYTKIVLAQNTPLMEDGRFLIPLMVAWKIPLLFLLTLLVCSFTLYLLNLAIGLKLHFLPAMTLMLFALAGTGVMLVVFSPIALLFTFVTESYHFMKILHVVIFGIAGLFGVKILAEGMKSMQTAGEEAPSAARGKVNAVLFSWLMIYCLVGAQLAWTLKPFLGTPYLPATPPFRLEKGNIFVSTMESVRGIKAADKGPAYDVRGNDD